jgi:hypothetical protein
MNPWLIALQAGLAAAKYIPFFVVGIQHLMPGHSGEDKMNAVLGMMLAGGAAAGDAVPSIAGQSSIISQTLTGVVQSVYDGIKQNQPQALLVHPENTIEGGTPAVTDAKTGAAVPQPAQPAQPQPQASGLG